MGSRALIISLIVGFSAFATRGSVANPGNYRSGYSSSSEVSGSEYVDGFQFGSASFAQYMARPDKFFPDDYAHGLSFTNKTDDFSYEKLVKLIEDKNLNTVEQTLAAIKENYPKSLEKYVLMYESRSLQKASPENPRVLSLAGSKEMVFSFNGHPDQSGFSQLEIMQFRSDTDTFEFREISFSASGGKPILSEANPAKCMNCHQADWRAQPEQNDPRPNWEPYNTWPGAIGSLDGELSRYIGANNRFDTDRDRHLLEKHKQEKVWLYNWIHDVQPEHARYQYLGEFPGPKFVLEFTKNLAILNSYRLGRIITSLDQNLYETVLPSLILVTNKRCDYSFLPRPVEKSPSAYPYAVSMSEELDAIFVPLGISTEDWSMDFRTGGRLSANKKVDRLRNPHSVEPFLALGMQKYDSENYNVQAEDSAYIGSSKTMEAARAQCDDAFEREVEARKVYDQLVSSGSVMLPASFQQLKSNRPLINRCVSCHSDDIAEVDDLMPYIPFDNPARLASVLVQGGYPRGTLLDEIRYRTGDYAHSSERMPKGHVPSLSAVEELMSYLEGLVDE